MMHSSQIPQQAQQSMPTLFSYPQLLLVSISIFFNSYFCFSLSFVTHFPISIVILKDIFTSLFFFFGINLRNVLNMHEILTGLFILKRTRTNIRRMPLDSPSRLQFLIQERNNHSMFLVFFSTPYTSQCPRYRLGIDSPLDNPSSDKKCLDFLSRSFMPST